jgi:hypothetical protein
MSLESDFEMAWTQFLTNPAWLRESGNGKALRDFAAITAASIKGLAAQIDRVEQLVDDSGIN